MEGKLRITRYVLVGVVLLALSVPNAASAVFSGGDGMIVFTSGRDSADGNDAEAKLYVGYDSFLLFSTLQTITPTAGVQHKHPAWSPDRTKIAYARGTPGSFLTEDFDIYVLDVNVPGALPRPITTPGDGVTSDRPAWSPDGTRIAYDNEVGNNIGQRDIVIATLEEPILPPPFPLSTEVSNLTSTPGTVETKAAWTPDSETIYYQTGSPSVANSMDVVSEPASGGTVTPIAANPAVSEFQSSISPDGEEMCFTRGSGFNNTTDVILANADGSGQQILSQNAATGDFNCTWSPSGAEILYVKGIFSSGSLVKEPSNNSQATPELVTDDPMNFDGNPDWAPDERPLCEDASVETEIDQPVTVPLVCLDRGPTYEKTYVQEFLGEQPANGTLGEIDQGEPSTVVYTPNPGFTGTDTFGFNGFDFHNFATPPRTVTVTVNPEVVPPEPPGPGKLTKPLIKAPKKVKQGKKLKARVQITNTGESNLTNVRICLKTKKKHIKGTGKRCRVLSNLAAGKTKAVKFKLKTKKFKKKRKTKLKAVASKAGVVKRNGHVTVLK